MIQIKGIIFVDVLYFHTRNDLHKQTKEKLTFLWCKLICFVSQLVVRPIVFDCAILFKQCKFIWTLFFSRKTMFILAIHVLLTQKLIQNRGILQIFFSPFLFGFLLLLVLLLPILVAMSVSWFVFICGIIWIWGSYVITSIFTIHHVFNLIQGVCFAVVKHILDLITFTSSNINCTSFTQMVS